MLSKKASKKSAKHPFFSLYPIVINRSKISETSKGIDASLKAPVASLIITSAVLPLIAFAFVVHKNPNGWMTDPRIAYSYILIYAIEFPYISIPILIILILLIASQYRWVRSIGAFMILIIGVIYSLTYYTFASTASESEFTG